MQPLETYLNSQYIVPMRTWLTFEEYCAANHIDENNIDDLVHESFVDENWSFVRHKPYYLYKSYVYETLLKSYDTKKLYDEILDNFGEHIVDNYSAYNDKATIKSLLLKYKDNSFKDNDKFKQILNLYNYFITYDDVKNKELHLEPNVPDDCTNYVYNDCDGIVYHLTNQYIYATKIKLYGLKPKTGKYREFPERVFLFTGETERRLETNLEYCVTILKDDPIYKSGKNNMVLLTIDLKKYKNKISIFKDNGMDNDSYWTSEYIPPYAITKVEKINIKL